MKKYQTSAAAFAVLVMAVAASSYGNRAIATNIVERPTLSAGAMPLVGKWKGPIQLGEGRRGVLTLEFLRADAKYRVSGEITREMDRGTQAYLEADVEVNGTEVSFASASEGATLRFKGKLADAGVSGTVEITVGGQVVDKGEWTLTKSAE